MVHTKTSTNIILRNEPRWRCYAGVGARSPYAPPTICSQTAGRPSKVGEEDDGRGAGDKLPVVRCRSGRSRRGQPRISHHVTNYGGCVIFSLPVERLVFIYSNWPRPLHKRDCPNRRSARSACGQSGPGVAAFVSVFQPGFGGRSVYFKTSTRAEPCRPSTFAVTSSPYR
jgi:hypothetical protein